MKPHKHAEVIKAWADGAKVQFRWIGDDSQWLDIDKPLWHEHQDYRVKPETLNYRVALFRNASGSYTSILDFDEEVVEWEGSSEFVRWLTDWVEVEV